MYIQVPDYHVTMCYTFIQTAALLIKGQSCCLDITLNLYLPFSLNYHTTTTTPQYFAAYAALVS